MTSFNWPPSGPSNGADSLDDPASVVAWLYRLHRNLIVDVVRKRSSEHRLIDPAAEVPDQAPPESSDPCACSVIQARSIHFRLRVDLVVG